MNFSFWVLAGIRTATAPLSNEALGGSDQIIGVT